MFPQSRLQLTPGRRRHWSQPLSTTLVDEAGCRDATGRTKIRLWLGMAKLDVMVLVKLGKVGHGGLDTKNLATLVSLAIGLVA